MAGGIGSRFWPVSTSGYPKQFQDVLGVGKTLIQSTYDRLTGVISKENIYVVTLKEYVDLTMEQLPELSRDQIIAESSGMNTAPSNIYAAELIYRKNRNANMVVAPSDHVIMDEKEFHDKLKLALEESEKEKILVTLGIKPTRPDTGYGYIQFIEDEDDGIRKVKTFTEKPGIELAEVLYKSGDFLWNSGIFIWKAKTILKAFKRHLPDMFYSFEKINYALPIADIEEKMEPVYSTLQIISIDNGILEKAENVYVIPSSFGWSDLGTWKSLFDHSNKNEENNVKIGKPVLTYNTENSLIYSNSDKAVVVDGLKDYIVIDTPKALLICPMDKDQSIKTFVNDLKLNKGEKFT